MTVTYVGGNQSYTTGSTLTITTPEGIQEGDLLVFAAISRNSYLYNSGGPNEGTWTIVDGVDVATTYIVTNPWTGSRNEEFGCWYKIAGDSEPTNYTINTSIDGSSNAVVGVLLVFRGSGTTTMVHAISGHTLTAPSITLTEDDNIAIGLWGTCHDGGYYIGTPSGWTEGSGYHNSPANQVILYSAFKSLESAGATGTATMSQSGVIDYTIAAQVGFSFECAAVTCTISLPSGEYPSSSEIELSADITGATIYYTTDGTDPTESSSVYSTPIPMFEGTLKAFAVASGYDDSEIVSATYTISSGVNNQPIIFIVT